MASTKINMLSSNIQKGIPLKLPSNKARILQMEMKLISSTPLRNSETRSNADDSDQLGSPIARINSADVSNNENQFKEIIPTKTNSNVKSNTSSENKNIINLNNLPGHNMVLYSSDDDDIIIISKKSEEKKTNKKRRLVPLKENTDSEILPKYTKNNVDNVKHIHIDKTDHVQDNDKHAKLINADDVNTNKNDLGNEISDNEIDISNKEVLKTKKIKYSSKKSTENKTNKETTNKEILQQTNLKAKRKALHKALQLHLSNNENLPDNKKKPKLQSNKKGVAVEIVLNNKNESKKNKTDHSEKDSKRKVKLSNVEQNLKKNVNDQNDEVREISQESANGFRKSSRQHIPSQAYWLGKSNVQPSNYTDTSDPSQHTNDDKPKEQISKKTEHKSVPSKTKISKIKQQKQSKELIMNGVKESSFTNILMPIEPIKSVQLDGNSVANPNNDLRLSGTYNPEESGSKKVTQNQHTDLDSRKGLQTKPNTLHEKEKQIKRIPAKKIHKLNSNSVNKQKKSSPNVDKQADSDNQSNGAIDINVDPDNNIPCDTLIVDFHQDNTSKSTNNNAQDQNQKNVIDNYSFKEIALAQRQLTEIENSQQPEYFGKFPQTYRTHPHNSNLSIGFNISNPNFISGVLEIVPAGKKQHEYPKKNNMFFFVLEGCAEVCVGNVSKILRIGDSFFVPNNTPYYIINLNNTKRLLMLFTKQAAT